MENHTLILSTPRINLPDTIDIDFAINLIEYHITNIENFGIELANQAIILMLK